MADGARRRWWPTRAVKYRSGAPRPQLEGLPRALADDLGPLVPVGARLHLVRRGARALGGAAARRRSTRSPARWRSRARTSACTTPPTSSPARCSATPWPAWAPRRREGRDRRAAERGQVLALQRAHARRRPGRQLPVHDGRAERGGGAGARRAARPGGRDRRRHAGGARGRSSSTTSPGWCAARTAARGSATSSSATSARPTRSCTWSAPTTTRRWCTRRAGWTRSPTWTPWTRSCCSPTSSRPSAGSSGWPSRPSRSTRWRWPRSAGSQGVVEALREGRAVRTVPPPAGAPGAEVRLQALTSKPVLYVANVAEGEPLEPPPELRGARRGARRPRDGGERPARLRAVGAGRRRGRGDARASWAWPSPASRP